MESIELKVIKCFIIWHILYVSFTLKISFYRDAFFGLAWCKTLACYIHRTLHHARWINTIFTARYPRWGEYNNLLKNVTRDVNQSESQCLLFASVCIFSWLGYSVVYCIHYYMHLTLVLLFCYDHKYAYI